MLTAVEMVKNKETREMLPPELMAADRVRQIGMKHGLLIYARRTSGGRFGEWFMTPPPLTMSVCLSPGVRIVVTLFDS
jgi:hypothetical protein